MNESENQSTGLEEAGVALFNFAVDREDTKALVANVSGESKCRPATVEYELQLLKIISTGWSISFFMENSPHRDQLAESFWKLVQGFSADLSDTSELMTGLDINYFKILRERLDMYVAALSDKPEKNDPAAIIGPEFARVCGDADDVFTVMAGARMFILTVARVKDYLKDLKIQ